MEAIFQERAINKFLDTEIQKVLELIRTFKGGIPDPEDYILDYINKDHKLSRYKNFVIEEDDMAFSKEGIPIEDSYKRGSICGKETVRRE